MKKHTKIATLLILLPLLGCCTKEDLSAFNVSDFVNEIMPVNEEKEKAKREAKAHNLEQQEVDRIIVDLNNRIDKIHYVKTSQESLDAATDEFKDMLKQLKDIKKKSYYWNDYDKTALNNLDKKLDDKGGVLLKDRRIFYTNDYRTMCLKSPPILSKLGFSEKYLKAKLMDVVIDAGDIYIENPTMREWLLSVIILRSDTHSIKKIQGATNPYTGERTRDEGIRIRMASVAMISFPDYRFLFEEENGKLYPSYFDIGNGQLLPVSGMARYEVTKLLSSITMFD